jgi:hypothetical protein
MTPESNMDDGSTMDSSSRGLLMPSPGVDLAEDFDLEDVLNEMDAENPMNVISNGAQSHSNSTGSSKGVIRNDKSAPITRPPTSSRDVTYSIAFWLHLFVIILLTLLEGQALDTSLIVYGKAGSWASMFMIITILGAFLGSMLNFIIANSSNKEILFEYSIKYSIITQIIFGFIILYLNTRYSFLFIFIFLSVIIDLFKYNRSINSCSFANAVLNVIIKIMNRYNTILVITCILLLLFQSFFLLWWGSLFVNLIASVHESYADVLIIIMLGSLYWIQQVFQSFVSYIVGGCVLWYFVGDDNAAAAAAVLSDGNGLSHNNMSTTQLQLQQQRNLQKRSQERLMLHLQCSLTIAFGTICKGALLSNASMYILELNDWSLRNGSGNYSNSNNNNNNNNDNDNIDDTTSRNGIGNICNCWNFWNKIISYSRRLIRTIVKPNMKFAKRHHRLAFCIASTYGRTFCRSALDHNEIHEETIDIAIEDTTTHIIASFAKFGASLLAILFGIFQHNVVQGNGTNTYTGKGEEGILEHAGLGVGIGVGYSNSNRSWGLFFIISYFLAYCGLSLALNMFRSAVDALIVAFGLTPERMANENQIIFSRFLRLMERYDTAI